ncbi:uncharacterized protein LOC143551040 [Bidens hawaiensis]|uniref:uncharacterized protein LOC143551040 n=1 Tax=Bidens hawaiensis TaxID=980011 RepID=UPI00404B3BF0
MRDECSDDDENVEVCPVKKPKNVKTSKNYKKSKNVKKTREGDEDSESDSDSNFNYEDGDTDGVDVDMRDFRLHIDFEVKHQDAIGSLEGLDIEMDDVMLDNDRMQIYACTAGFLSNHLVTDLQDDPKLKVKSIKEGFQRRFDVGVPDMKAYTAKMLAKEHINGNFRVKLELEECSDPTSETRQFKRIYVCLGSLKKGFKEIGRDLLGLDGAFLKSAWPWKLLTTVALDPNNGYYPVAYAAVEAETMNSWEWFLECLGDDLDLNNRSKFTFMSDRQKGLIQAVDKFFPSAEHRFCVRHIEDNLRTLFKGKLYTDALWKLARCTKTTHYEREMKNLKKLNKMAHLWVSKVPPETWSRSHCTGRAMSDALNNNMCECFNSKLVDGRDKPIITLLEYIREYVMRKIVNVLKVIDRSSGLLTPYATQMMEYSVHWNGEDHYQVTGPNGDQCVVNMTTNTCACRRWEIPGIPCRHVVASIWVKGAHDGTVGGPETFVNPIYTMDRWKAVYSY